MQSMSKICYPDGCKLENNPDKFFAKHDNSLVTKFSFQRNIRLLESLLVVRWGLKIASQG